VKPWVPWRPWFHNRWVEVYCCRKCLAVQGPEWGWSLNEWGLLAMCLFPPLITVALEVWRKDGHHANVGHPCRVCGAMHAKGEWRVVIARYAQGRWEWSRECLEQVSPELKLLPPVFFTPKE